MAKAATIQINESDLAASEALARSVRQELASSADRLRAVQDELSTATQRVASLESEQQASLQRYHDSDATIAAYAQEARQADAGRTAAQEELNMKEQELLDLQNRLTEAEESLAQLEGLRAQVAELEPAQGRVHWLEVQLTEKDVEHRAALHQVDSQLAERDRRIGELERLQPQLKEREALLTQWETKYAHTLAQHEAQLAKLQKQLAAQDQLRAQLLLDEQLLHERDERIAGLQHQIQELEAQQQDLAGQVKMAGEKQEEITLLRKRLVEVRAALRIKTNGGTVAPRQTRQNGSQLNFQMEQAKAAKDGQKDDLSKIPRDRSRLCADPEQDGIAHLCPDCALEAGGYRQGREEALHRPRPDQAGELGRRREETTPGEVWRTTVRGKVQAEASRKAKVWASGRFRSRLKLRFSRGCRDWVVPHLPEPLTITI